MRIERTPALCQCWTKTIQVASEYWADIGIDDGCAGAFVFAWFGQDAMRWRNEEDALRRACCLFEHCGNARFVTRVGITVDQADRNRLDRLRVDPGDQRASSSSSRGISTLPFASVRSTSSKRHASGTGGSGRVTFRS